MFINSKINLLVRNDGEIFKIQKDFIGEIPDKIANTWLIQQAIKSGHIATPNSKTDKALEAADKVAEEASKAAEAETADKVAEAETADETVAEEPKKGKKSK